MADCPAKLILGTEFAFKWGMQRRNLRDRFELRITRNEEVREVHCGPVWLSRMLLTQTRTADSWFGDVHQRTPRFEANRNSNARPGMDAQMMM